MNRSEGVSEHTDVGAYALGLLERDDRQAFETHLAGCAQCARELTDFSGLRDLLTGLDGPVELDELDDPPVRRPFSADGDVAVLLRRRRTAARRRRRGTAILGLAAGIALLAGGITVGAAVASSGGFGNDHGKIPADLLVWGVTREATDAKTGVSGIVAMEDKGWGTHLALDITHVKGPLTCELVAVSKTGDQHIVTEWAVPPLGYGEPGAPDHLQVHGGTAFTRAELGHFEIRDQTGGTLLTIPA
jgi:hypothetical protein